ncbi:MAG: hypothetical protein HY744_28140 [Deltaproteobacteria bacterium]|nr:hypothetical protein [Deltaproteobacteria bacterium]
MPASAQRWAALLVVVAALLGLAFAAVSSFDYIAHLDRQVHDLSCSLIPGMGAAPGADEGCRAAMYSPYSAVLHDRYWGGIPIALFAVGCYAFFAAFGLYALLRGRATPRRAVGFLALAGLVPLAASLVMAAVSAAKLGQFCQTCVGMYVASALLAVGAIWGWAAGRNAERAAQDGAGGSSGRGERRAGGGLVLAWLVALGAFAVVPAMVYVKSAPAYDVFLDKCGALGGAPKSAKDFVRVTPRTARVPALLLFDPLCPSCKGLHQRLDSEGYAEQLDLTLVPFPLDSACNWMLDRPVHPGACELAKAVLCAEHRAAQMLGWIYDEQERLAEAGKAPAGQAAIQAAIRERWPELAACTKNKETARRLDRVLRFAVDKRLPISTPQLFVAGKRVCDEDTDLGLAYALPRLVPELRKP